MSTALDMFAAALMIGSAMTPEQVEQLDGESVFDLYVAARRMVEQGGKGVTE